MIHETTRDFRIRYNLSQSGLNRTRMDFVLVVCTENYVRRFKGKEEPGKGLGVKWEGAILTQELYEAEAKNTDFIPVIFSPDDSAHIPVVLRGATHYKINTEEGYKALYRHLTHQPPNIKPELGEIEPMPPRERKQKFVETYWNVPYPRNPFFTGRENVLDQLHQALISNKSIALSQPIAISGLGGIGKTQTAVEYAYQYGKEYKFVLWAKADSREALISDYAAIAELLNLPEKNDQEQNLAVIATKRWLEGNIGWLLILDNADDPEIIEDFLPLKRKGHILLTSRAQAFDNIGIANPVELDKMLPKEAKEFFFARTGRINLEPAEIEAIENIAQELDYLPLAMEQAGAYISKIKCSFQDYLSSYRERGLMLLEKFQASTGKYPKSVATTWSLNFEQVTQKSPSATDLLYASAFLNHDNIPFEIISLGAKELGSAISSSLDSVENDPLVLDEVLEPLIQYSLVHRDSDTRTYNIHRLVQAVLRDRMDASTQRIWSERVVKATNCAFPEVVFSEWDLCDRLLPHAQVCFERINKVGFEFQEAATLLNGAGCYLRIRARFGEAKLFLKRALDIQEKVLEPDHPDVAASLNNLAAIYRDQGKYAEAEPLYKRALDIQEKVLEPDHPDVAISLNNLAALYLDQGKYEEAEPFFKRALDIWEKVLGPDHPDVAISLNNLAALYRNQGKYEEAEPFFKRALDIREKVLEPDHPDAAKSLNNLAELYHNQGKYEEAEPLYKRALDIREKVLGPDHPDVATSLNNLAVLYHDQGKYEEAEPLYKRALDIREKVLGPDHPDVAISLNNLAELYHNQGKYEEAEPFFKRALDIREKVLEPDHPDVAASLNNLAVLYHDQGKYEEAEPLYKRALDIREKVQGPDHPDVAISLNNLAELYHNQGKYEEAEPFFKRALDIREKVLEPDHPDVAASLNNLAVLYHDQGKYEEAEPLYKRALDIREKVQGPDHPDVAKSLNNLALFYSNQRKYAKAKPLYIQSIKVAEKSLGKEHTVVATYLTNYAIVLRKINWNREAKKMERRAKAIRDKKHK